MAWNFQKLELLKIRLIYQIFQNLLLMDLLVMQECSFRYDNNKTQKILCEDKMESSTSATLRQISVWFLSGFQGLKAKNLIIKFRVSIFMNIKEDISLFHFFLRPQWI